MYKIMMTIVNDENKPINDDYLTVPLPYIETNIALFRRIVNAAYLLLMRNQEETGVETRIHNLEDLS